MNKIVSIISRLKNRVLKNHYLKWKNYHIDFIDSITLTSELNYIFTQEVYYFSTVNPKPFIVDCGSFVGASIIYFKSLYPNSSIIGFEPDKKICKLLFKNLKSNSIVDVRIVNAAVGKKTGRTGFFADSRDGGSLKEIEDGKRIKVKMVRLSDYINHHVDLLKMNIEGGECDVIEEVADKLHFVDQVIIEYHCFNKLQQNLHKILSILDQKGFIYFVTDLGPVKERSLLYKRRPYKLFNLIYAKKRLS